MNVEILINNSNQPAARFVTWAPSPCLIRVTNPAGATGANAAVQLKQATVAGGTGTVRFASSATAAGSVTLNLNVPVSGASVKFFIRGKDASNALGDVKITAVAGGAAVGDVNVMVRVRKDGDKLTTGERDRFLSALAKLNNQGLGRFTDFRDMHVAASDLEAHGRPGFLSWHRAYILDLERELQAIDPSVALPYWRFDQPVAKLFTADYLGKSNGPGFVTLSAANPLRFWKTDGVVGIDRSPIAGAQQPLSQAATLNLGDPGATFARFRRMEGDPHGTAHVMWNGSIRSKATAARDPLFFLLHCNVDRLWALWQKSKARFDPSMLQSFDSNNFGKKAGHNLADTMWPWNGVTTGDRPNFAPGGTLAPSPCVSAPGPSPKVSDCLDFMGKINAANNLGYCYDDVAF